jgi:Methyltransferase domain
MLAAAQRRLSVRGPVCEIGVHHGRLFILLHLLAATDQRSVAIDLFALQHENIDHSGEGSLDMLLRNVQRHGGDLHRIKVVAENSRRLTAQLIVEACDGRPCLLSVDGGHMADISCHDLGLAHDAICEGGIVILDDYFNPAWPGVSEGTCRFMEHHNRHLEPVAITSNKFFMAHGTGPAESYREELLRRYPHAKSSIVFGRPVLCFETPTPMERIVFSPAWRALRQTGLGRIIRRARARWQGARV